ncbi:MAG: PqiC family protein [Desulfobacterales bacterium]|nr:PqiC family protein [Desulfobacterales bacterium]MDJ0873781.1 PqiC family protein [Desulfobacterales bacterium]MDJ0883488.1 PqiC family protein [Desulfobacterales bacterium]
MRFTATKSMVLAMGLILVLLSGCVNLGPGTTDSTRLFVLTPMSTNDAAPDRTGIGSQAIGVGPLIFPEYLNRPQVVTRRGENEVRTAAFANWAEPLQQNFRRVLSENLALLLGTDAIYNHPWRSTLKPDQRVELEIIRFDADPQGDAVLDVRWEITDARGKQLRPKSRAVFRQKVSGEGHAAIVTAMSLTLADFSRHVAAAIAALA